MKVNYWHCCALLLSVSLFTACERSIDLTEKSGDLKPSSANDASSSKCRLTYTNYGDGYFTDTYQYNSDGLVSDYKSVWFGSISVHATMEYDAKGRLVKGTQSYDGNAYVDAVFEYENNRIVKEDYYEPGTTNLVDLVINTYNVQGQLVERDDPLYEIYCLFEYDAVGNCIKSEVRQYDEYLLFGRVFTYGKPIKDPSTARPGTPPFNWWYINDVPGPNAPLTEDQYVDDGNGGEFIVYDEDPAKTVITTTSQNLEDSKLSWDDAFGIEYYQYWEYENCGGKNISPARSKKVLPQLDQQAKDKLFLQAPLLAGPMLKTQLADRKAAIERLKNNTRK